MLWAIINTLHIFNKEKKTKSEKRREIEDVKKIQVELLELKDTALETKNILDEIKVD